MARWSRMTSTPADDWPDWRGETALICGTGPSIASMPLHLARDRVKVIAIKSAWLHVPWADVLYGIDRGWWIAHQGAKGFAGIKCSPSPTAARVFGLRQTRVKLGARLVMEPIGTLGCGLRDGGGHSGWQAINLAVQLGARRIVLAGFEMTWRPGVVPAAGVARPDAQRIERWRAEMDAAVSEFSAIGCEVVNATPGSALRNYPFCDFEEALTWRSKPVSRRSTATST